MNNRKVTLAAAAAGVLTGAAGLSLLAMPAGAGQPPSLPNIAPETLVEQVLTSKPGAFGGTVEVDNKLGLPSIAEIPQLADGKHSARIWTDGNGKLRLALPNGQSEQTIVDDGTTTWSWNSQDNEVTKSEHKDGRKDEAKPDNAMDPATAAKEIVSKTKEFSDISVDGTARVANRAAYELVLTPKAGEKTLVREVRIAVDSELKMPLRVAVLTNGTAEPVGQVGFSQINVGPQDSKLFEFTPPSGAKVTTPEAKEEQQRHKPEIGIEQALRGENPQIFGTGWDTVVGARIPADAMTQVPAEAQGLVDRFTKKVSGNWGSGKLFTTKVATILIADDGRVVAGAVPEQVLFDTIGQVK
ncbi:LolA family protein [Lentzea aerocolonigenes]|uniref:LolA family protein n=1 Tax=Lentzea aerocolonigenes TaxID=68170 RepID=UPI0004C3210A|nr:sigma-E factor regulatory protein RseB domain-containing protein [Lentzea aerocolonigenes]MCP2249760.1 Outer membrane lipoprotein-sorting protein [Lentzea aerocolonigenes]